MNDNFLQTLRDFFLPILPELELGGPREASKYARIFPKGGHPNRSKDGTLASIELEFCMVLQTPARDSADRDEAVCKLLRAGLYCEENSNTVRMTKPPELYRILQNGEEEYHATFSVTYSAEQEILLFYPNGSVYAPLSGFSEISHRSEPVTRTTLLLHHGTSNTDLLYHVQKLTLKATANSQNPAHIWLRTFAGAVGAEAKTQIVICHEKTDTDGVYTATLQPVCVALHTVHKTLDAELLFDGDGTPGTFNTKTGAFV